MPVNIDLHALEDLPTIKNAIRKRIPEVQDIVVAFFSDAVGIALAVDIDGVLHPLKERLRRDMTHADLMNGIDKFAEQIKTLRTLQRANGTAMGEVEYGIFVAKQMRRSPLGIV